jgi:hypothetical protein
MFAGWQRRRIDGFVRIIAILDLTRFGGYFTVGHGVREVLST